MTIFKGGSEYGFCPGKATWDGTIKQLYAMLQVSTETGNLWDSGGIKDQPDWFIELLSWFLPRYDTMKFVSKADMILGGGSTKTTKSKKPGPGRLKGGRLG